MKTVSAFAGINGGVQSGKTVWLASLLLCVLALMPPGLCAATNNLTSALQQGLFEEEANRNLEAAIASYQSLAAQFDQDRQVAATAIFRLGECYRKLGRTNDAVVQYQRILREFGDQTTLTTLSRQNLTGLSPAAQPHFQDRLVATITRVPQDSTASTATDPAARATGIEAEAASLKTQVEQLSSLKREAARVAVQQNFPNPVLTKLMQDLDDAEQKLAGLTNDYAPQDMHVVRATALVNTINGQIDAQVDGAIKGLQSKMEADLNAAKALRDKSGSAIAAGAQATTVITDEEETEIRRIQAMIQNSPDLINASSGEGKPAPLGNAAYNGQLRVAAFLLANGADVNFKVNDWPPLFFAAAKGHRAMVELFLAKGADVNTRDSSGKTPLFLAAENGFQSVAEALLVGKADVNTRDKYQYTPLHYTARKGHSAMVACLLAHRADPDAQDQNGRTPLSIAAQAGHAETLKKLLAAGARPDLVDNEGRTPLSYAVEYGHLDSAKVLLAARANPNGGRGVLPLHLSIHRKNSMIMKLLLDAGADADRISPVNWGFVFGGTRYGRGDEHSELSPLFLAIVEDSADAVKLLLEHKADPNGTDPNGLPVIVSAMDQPEIVKALLEAGANPNVDDGQGCYPLIKARDPETVRLLLAQKANPEVRFNGFTPLLQVAGWPPGDKACEIAEVLLRNGANVNAASEPYGWTALHIAASKGNQKLVELLLANKGDVNVRNNEGKTPLDLVKEQSSPRPGSPGMQTMPTRPLRPPGTSQSPPQAQTVGPASLADVLRQHGALDNLPDFNRIRITRQGVSQPWEVFHQGPKLTNQFTLLETVMRFYSQSSVRAGINGPLAQPYDVLRFPDFGRIIIRRPSQKPGGKEQEIKVSLLNSSNVVDCAKDVSVEFGDVIEIPERVHALNESYPDPMREMKSDLNQLMHGISMPPFMATNAGIAAMKAEAEARTRRWACLQKTVQLVVAGETTTFKVNSWEEGFLKEALAKTEARTVLRSSSDLSRVKVTRQTGKSAKPVVLTVDASDKSPRDSDLWLQDGDVIEVPEK